MSKAQIMLNKPTITIRAKNFKLALYAHVLTLISAPLLALFGLLALGHNLVGGIFQIIAAAVIIAIELAYIDVDILNQGLVRGLVYIILVILVFGFSRFGTESILALLLIIASVLDIVHDLN